MAINSKVYVYLVIWSYVGKIDKGIYSQGHSETASLPGTGVHLFTRDLQCSQVLKHNQEFT